MAIREAHLEKACSVCGGPLFACDGKHADSERRAAENKRSPRSGLGATELFGDVDLSTPEAPDKTTATRLRGQIMGHVERLKITDSPLGRALDRNLNMVDLAYRAKSLEPVIQGYLKDRSTEVDLEKVLKTLIATRASREQQKKAPERRAA